MQNRFRVCFTCEGFFTTEEDHNFCSKDCEEREIIEVYTDAGTIGLNGRGAKGITWSYCFIGKNNILLEHNTGYSFDLTTNVQGEAASIIEALEKLPKDWKGKVSSDCLYALKVVFRTGYWDGKIWNDKKLDSSLKTRRDKLDLSGIEIELLSGHPTKKELEAGVAKNGRRVSEWNVLCDEACTEMIERIRSGNYV